MFKFSKERKEDTPMSVKELTNITLTDLWKEYNSFINFWEAEEDAFKEFKKFFIEEALEEERTMLIGCTIYERKAERRDYRNGCWKRWITLKDGRLEIRMPRIRGMRYESKIIPRYKQRVKEVDTALLRIFLYGASTRLTGEALRPILGEGISAQTISNMKKDLDKCIEGARAIYNLVTKTIGSLEQSDIMKNNIFKEEVVKNNINIGYHRNYILNPLIRLVSTDLPLLTTFFVLYKKTCRADLFVCPYFVFMRANRYVRP